MPIYIYDCLQWNLSLQGASQEVSSIQCSTHLSMVSSSAEELSLPLYVCMTERIQWSLAFVSWSEFIATKTVNPVTKIVVTVLLNVDTSVELAG